MTVSQLGSLSDGQQAALTEITKWYKNGGYQPLTLGGLAGTGKTTLVSLLPEVLPDAKIVFVAYTGKAVSVLQAKLTARGVNSELISTIHRLLYQPKISSICLVSNQIVPRSGGKCQTHASFPDPCAVRDQVSFDPVDYPLAGIDLVVADEASMIPEKLWLDLTSHCVPVMAVGDHGQLPPVRSSFNLMADPHIRLEEIHRQAAGSPILAVAQWARQTGQIPPGWYGENVVKVARHELAYVGLHPRDADMIICAKNATRQWHNAAMRNIHGHSGPPAAGDVVICLRNNYEEGLFNGLRGTITQIFGETVSANEPAIDMEIELEGVPEPWTGAVSAVQFGQRGTLSNLNRDLALFDYGYAITCHKSQGSSAGSVIVIEENWPSGPDRSRWLYTAVTRAEHTLTVVSQ